MLIGWIITGAIAVPFLILSFFLFKGKGSSLIAGFNTLSEEKKAVYDKEALCKAVGWLLLIMAVLMFLFPLAMQLEAMWLFWIVFILFMVLPIGFAIYANTGNRFKKEISPYSSETPREKKPMSRGKKAAIVIVIILSVQICIGVTVMIIQGERDPDVTVDGSRIKISALYGLEINLSDVTEITLINSSMREIGIGSRTNGYSTTGNALKGTFSSPETGQQLLFVYSSSSPTIRISRTRGVDVFISFRNSETTITTYQELSAARS